MCIWQHRVALPSVKLHFEGNLCNVDFATRNMPTLKGPVIYRLSVRQQQCVIFLFENVRLRAVETTALSSLPG